MGRFVVPAIVRLPLSNGDWIDIKKQLTHGEQDAMLARFAPVQTPGQPIQMQSQHVRTTTVLAFLHKWSFVNDDGEPVEYGPHIPEDDRVATLNALDPDAFDEIEAAINKHVEAREQEKKLTKAASEKRSAAPTSLPRSVADGELIGSVTST